jgi:hypothetical protein
MANRSRSPEQKVMLKRMASTWDSLAADREVQIARQGRMAALERAADGSPAGSTPIDSLNASNDE